MGHTYLMFYATTMKQVHEHDMIQRDIGNNLLGRGGDEFVCNHRTGVAWLLVSGLRYNTIQSTLSHTISSVRSSLNSNRRITQIQAPSTPSSPTTPQTNSP